jgi:hypothetical protein
MDIKTFNETILPILQFAISILGLGAVILLWWQIRITTTWNKLKSNHSFINSEEDEAETELIIKSKAIGIDLKLRKTPLTNDEVDEIIKNDGTYCAIARFLLFVENNCTAINAGIVDKKLAYAAYAPRVLKIYEVYYPYIQKIQQNYGDKQLYIELEKVALEIAKLKSDKELIKEQLIKKLYSVEKRI